MSSLIEVQSLARSFGDFHAVRGISFTVSAGEVVGFLGPNGAGKSTTMNMLAGALAPSTGSIRIDGVDLLEDPLAAKARVGYLPEHPPLYRDQTVDEWLAFCAALHGVPRAARQAALTRAKARVGLADAGRRLIANLSKGFQQRAGIAQALVHEPAIVILDEPTAGLDPNQIREIRALIRALGKDHCVMLSTHILAEVQTVCDRVLMLNAGEIVLDSALGELVEAAPTRHRVRLRDAVSDAALAALGTAPGVVKVERDDTARTVLAEHDGSDAAVDALVTVLGVFGLRELAPLERSLEELFVSLTLGGH